MNARQQELVENFYKLVRAIREARKHRITPEEMKELLELKQTLQLTHLPEQTLALKSTIDEVKLEKLERLDSDIDVTDGMQSLLDQAGDEVDADPTVKGVQPKKKSEEVLGLVDDLLSLLTQGLDEEDHPRPRRH